MKETHLPVRTAFSGAPKCNLMVQANGHPIPGLTVHEPPSLLSQDYVDLCIYDLSHVFTTPIFNSKWAPQGTLAPHQTVNGMWRRNRIDDPLVHVNITGAFAVGGSPANVTA